MRATAHRIFSACAVVAIAAIAAIALSSESHADPLHAIGGGAYWHHDSGWIFPERIGDFVRVGAPQDVGGSRDVIVYYAHGNTDARATASIEIYPTDSVVGEMTFADAKANLVRELTAKIESEGPFRLETQTPITAAKASFTAHRDGSATQANLYFVEAGDWRIKLRLVASKTDTRSLQQMDDFARSQTWSRLGNQEPPCMSGGCTEVANNR